MNKVIFLFLLSGLLTVPSYLTTASTCFNKSQKQIKLYTYPTCPACVSVKKFLQKKNWYSHVVIVDANNPKNAADLKRISGKDYCPYLVDEINNVNMGESHKIMNYFKTIFHETDDI